VWGGPRGERPSKHFKLNSLHKIQKLKDTRLFITNMGNTKYEHAVVTAHQINNQEVTTDTPLDFIEQNIEVPSTSIARANDFNNTLLTSVDDFFFPELFEFEFLEPSSQDSDQSNFSSNHFTK